MKVLFLDIDGVLNSSAWMITLKKGKEANRVYGGDGDQWWIDMLEPRAVLLLNEVLECTGAKVVLSSTWRLRHTPEAMQRLLKTRGFTGEVIGRTPRMAGQRGYEIRQWLKEHPEVETYAIVDDDSDMEPIKDHRFIQTSWFGDDGPGASTGKGAGLQPDHVARLIEVLGEETTRA